MTTEELPRRLWRQCRKCLNERTSWNCCRTWFLQKRPSLSAKPALRLGEGSVETLHLWGGMSLSPRRCPHPCPSHRRQRQSVARSCIKPCCAQNETTLTASEHTRCGSALLPTLGCLPPGRPNLSATMPRSARALFELELGAETATAPRRLP